MKKAIASNQVRKALRNAIEIYGVARVSRGTDVHVYTLLECALGMPISLSDIERLIVGLIASGESHLTDIKTPLIHGDIIDAQGAY